MHRRVLLLLFAIVYFVLSTCALIVFDAGLIFTTAVLFGIPAYILARFSAAPAAVLVVVATFGAGISIVLEGIAHTYGIWYTIGVEELRLFGLIPIEVIGTSVVQTLFLVLLYELMFDDGEYTEDTASTRFISFGVFFVGALTLLALHQYLLKGIFFAHSYVWILGILVASILSSLAVTHSLTLRFFDRLCAFVCFTSVPLLCGLLVSLVNTQKVFAYSHDYLYTFTVFGNMVPIEELLLVIVLPLFVATVYELYLDDGK